VHERPVWLRGPVAVGVAALLKAVWWDFRLADGLVFLFLFCTVTDFSAAEKDRGVNLCVLVRLLSGQVFSYFVEVWLAWSHGGSITSGMNYTEAAVGQSELDAVAQWAVGIRGGAVE